MNASGLIDLSAKVEQIILECYVRSADIIIQGRRANFYPKKLDHIEDSLNNSEYSLAVLNAWKSDVALPLVIDISLLLSQTTTILIERWKFTYVRRDDSKDNRLSSIKKRILTFLRTLYSFIRLLPGYQVLKFVPTVPNLLFEFFENEHPPLSKKQLESEIWRSYEFPTLSAAKGALSVALNYLDLAALQKIFNLNVNITGFSPVTQRETSKNVPASPIPIHKSHYSGDRKGRTSRSASISGSPNDTNAFSGQSIKNSSPIISTNAFGNTVISPSYERNKNNNTNISMQQYQQLLGSNNTTNNNVFNNLSSNYSTDYGFGNNLRSPLSPGDYSNSPLSKSPNLLSQSHSLITPKNPYFSGQSPMAQSTNFGSTLGPNAIFSSNALVSYTAAKLDASQPQTQAVTACGTERTVFVLPTSFKLETRINLPESPFESIFMGINTLNNALDAPSIHDANISRTLYDTQSLIQLTKLLNISHDTISALNETLHLCSYTHAPASSSTDSDKQWLISHNSSSRNVLINNGATNNLNSNSSMVKYNKVINSVSDNNLTNTSVDDTDPNFIFEIDDELPLGRQTENSIINQNDTSNSKLDANTQNNDPVNVILTHITTQTSDADTHLIRMNSMPVQSFIHKKMVLLATDFPTAPIITHAGVNSAILSNQEAASSILGKLKDFQQFRSTVDNN